MFSHWKYSSTGFLQILEFKRHIIQVLKVLESGLGPGKVMEMWIAGMTNFLMISLNDYVDSEEFGHIRYLVEFVNFCLEEIDKLK